MVAYLLSFFLLFGYNGDCGARIWTHSIVKCKQIFLPSMPRPKVRRATIGTPCDPIDEQRKDKLTVVEPLAYDPFGFNQVLNVRATHVKADAYAPVRAPNKNKSSEKDTPKDDDSEVDEQPITKNYGSSSLLLAKPVTISTEEKVPDEEDTKEQVSSSKRVPLQLLTNDEVAKCVPKQGTKRRQAEKAPNVIQDENVDICDNLYDKKERQIAAAKKKARPQTPASSVASRLRNRH